MRPSLANRLTDYVKITERDEMIAEYVDYIRFYGDYRSKAKILFNRDNGECINIGCFRLVRAKNKQFIVELYYFYWGYDVHIASFTENYVNSKSVLRCDLYWKGLLVLNREDLRPQMELVFNFFSFQEVVLSRIDYAVDCQKVNWDKACSLNVKYTNVLREKWVPCYVAFWVKESSPQFIRYYDKIKDLVDSEFTRLYPEYEQYWAVMRYELQVNSDWIGKDFKIRKIEDIKCLANFWTYVPKQSRTHHKLRYEPEDYKQVEKIILRMRKRWDWHSLVKILNLAYQQTLLSWAIQEEESTRLIREKLALKASEQDEKIYWEALKKLLGDVEIK